MYNDTETKQVSENNDSEDTRSQLIMKQMVPGSPLASPKTEAET